MKKGTATILFLLLMALLAGFVYTAYYGLGADKSGSLSSIDLGLDLAGGVSITYGVTGEEAPSAEDMSDTIYKLQRRVDVYSTEAQVYQEGMNRINIEIPGVTDANTILEELGQPGNLYFIKQKDPSGTDNYDAFLLTPAKTIEEMKEEGSVILEGSDVASARVVYQSSGNSTNQQPVVELRFNDNGKEAFAKATAEAATSKETIGIYYDGEIISAPTVRNAIPDGNAIIEGSFTFERAEQLASTIRIGGLKVSLEELRSNVVGAQLGANAINTSLKAAVIGFVCIILFMLIVYRLMGLAASLALGFYGSLMVILLSAFDVTLTLPGIAGIILSIGMAVDANVLIFARIREEIALGKGVKASMQSGYKKALSAILDGNITTIIAAAVLYFLGTGSVKGFALTLFIGIITSMITALFISRALMSLLHDMGFSAESLYGRAKEPGKFDFVGKRKMFYGISVAVILAGVAVMAMNFSQGKGALNYNLDFVGGTATSVTFNEPWTTEALDNEVVPKIREVASVPTVQTQTVSGGNEVIFKTVPLSAAQRTAISEMLESDYGVAEANVTAETISATISDEMQRDATIAVIVALVLMLFYIRIRFKDFKFGASAIIALVHDALVVIAAYAVSRIGVGSTFIACVLTIIGYSINNTIVTFDRVRENMGGASSRGGLQEVVNSSVSQTLTRSLFTSLTTFVMVFMLFLFGVKDIRDFALPLMAGVVAGTYSSIFIASPLWYDLRSATARAD
ncbi:MAG: protein translocase subunit SecD [Lachnospiraceae bacterium]|nr:protein translocase subunit SecD [Lachnospiraceae bacterium]